MYQINDDLSIYVTRGDIVFFKVTAEDNGEPYKFRAGDVLRMTVYEKKACHCVALQKDFPVLEDTDIVDIFLEEKDTRIGNLISKPVDYWYEIELNPLTAPQTIIGYDEDGAKVFKLFPEGDKLHEAAPDIEPEDIPIIDKELDLLSNRPVENRVVSAALIRIEERAKAAEDTAAAYTGAIQEHFDNKENPHNVTKEQLGLGNVENVAINDQTPTYEQAKELQGLTGGEKLSAAFGKIAKAVTDFIAHLGNKDNPHGVTAAQVKARPDTWMPSAEEVGARPNTWKPNAEDIGAVPAIEDSNNPGCYYRTVNGVAEWINPPMTIGLEYKTAERYNGKAVWTVLADLNTCPAGETIVNTNFTAASIVRWGNMDCVYEAARNDKYMRTKRVSIVNGNLTVTNIFGELVESSHEYCQIWYTKD